MSRLIWFAVFIFILAVQCVGIKQKRAANKLAKRQADTMQTPYWKAMMDDTNSLYHLTISAFDLYWKNKKRPIRDEDNEGKDLFGQDKDEELGNIDQVFDYKRFLNWKQKNQYKIKPDGRVMTSYDIIKLWKHDHLDSI